MLYYFATCNYAGRHSAECHYAECRLVECYAKYHYAVCRNTEYRHSKFLCVRYRYVNANTLAYNSNAQITPDKFSDA